MPKQVQALEFTKASSKGQIVIPTKIRKRLGIQEGSLFAVTAEGDMIVLKKVNSILTADDMKSLKLVEEAWKDVEDGKYQVRSREAFFKELKDW
ncbi:MAG: AbrB/MazE/SpoVT family DNA-binding domain-containing protein [Thaumarchaeota archaeon]|nr:AbrB/MazE/SpoVT family DNA-binding domain-containing protein [Nitrososphaerota archaeon]